MWFVFLIIGAAVATLVMWLRAKGVSLKWYEYLMGALGLLLAFGAVQHAVSALAWDYTTSAWLGALTFGLSALILLAVAGQLAWRRHRAA